MRQVPGNNANTLASWKEIASYMGRGVRTVQRWEAELRLPVHRVGSERGSVFAFRAELDNWLRVQGAEANPCTPTNEAQARGRQNALRALDKSTRLATETLRLLQRQRAQTQLITEQLRRLAHLVPRIGRWGKAPAVTEGDVASIALRQPAAALRRSTR